MKIKSVKLVNFRSYKEAVFKFSPNLTFIVGPNGVGKTNLLEAIYLLGASRSWRAKDKSLVKTGSKWFRVEGNYDKQQLSVAYDAETKQKKLSAGNKSYRAEEFIGRMPLTLFEPAHLAIVAGEPAERRRWLDQVLSMQSRKYLMALLQYRRTLKQRNALLRRGSVTNIKDQIFAWDVTLAEQAGHIYKMRRLFIEFLAAEAPKQYARVAPKSNAPAFSYVSAANGKDYSSQLLEKLSLGLDDDIRHGFTRVGPHREDIKIEYLGRPIATIASRGEVRTATLVCKLCELKFLSTQAKRLPILLLDDVFSELDSRRRDFLLEQLGGIQTLLTTTSLSGLKTKLPQKHTVIKL